MPGTWKPLDNQPTFQASTMLLLTDGTVMCQQSGGVNWYRLTPDANGDYTKGTWSALAPMINTRLYYASVVLRDGRVIVGGGEYSDAGSETNKCEMYDPLADAWSAVHRRPAGRTWAMPRARCCLMVGCLSAITLERRRRFMIRSPIVGWRVRTKAIRHRKKHGRCCPIKPC